MRRGSDASLGPGRQTKRADDTIGQTPRACDPVTAGLIAPIEQAAGDDLGLDLGGTLEDAEDARVAQEP
jgi:hypothetical protein